MVTGRREPVAPNVKAILASDIGKAGAQLCDLTSPGFPHHAQQTFGVEICASMAANPITSIITLNIALT